MIELDARGDAGYRHEAFLYRDAGEFLQGAARFVRGGVQAGEPVLVILRAEKLDWLRDELGADAGAVEFADLAEVGRNPARIIPAWRAFVDAGGDAGRQPVRGLGEPVDPTRDGPAQAESQIHESLLNLAFPDDPPFWLLCPYDTEHLDPAAVAGAHGSHPHLRRDGSTITTTVGDPAATFRALDTLSPVPTDAVELAFWDADGIRSLRAEVAGLCHHRGLPAGAADDLVAAAHEAATNSLRYGGGGGAVSLWHDASHVYCEVRDQGVIADPLTGRVLPRPEQFGGRGVWLANHLCDLVQIRSGPGGTVVRLRQSLTTTM